MQEQHMATDAVIEPTTEPTTEPAEVQEETTEEELPLAAEAAEEVVEVSKSLEPEDTEEAPAWEPNYKLKIMDEEREVDEMLRPLMKDAESEKFVRELCEKAYGLEWQKPKYEELKEKYPELENKYNEFYGQINDIVSLRDKDLDAFFDAVGLSEDQIAKHMLEKVKRMDLPEDQRRVYDEFSETRRKNYDLEKQLQVEQERNQQVAVQARTHELSTVLERPEIAAYAKAYDTARKKTGAFKEAVVRHGTAEWNINKRDLGAEQAVHDTMSFLGDAYKGQQAHPVAAQVDAPLPVIPRVSGKSVSPTGKVPRSIEDLKKLSAEMSS